MYFKHLKLIVWEVRLGMCYFAMVYNNKPYF